MSCPPSTSREPCGRPNTLYLYCGGPQGREWFRAPRMVHSVVFLRVGPNCGHIATSWQFDNIFSGCQARYRRRRGFIGGVNWGPFRTVHANSNIVYHHMHGLSVFLAWFFEEHIGTKHNTDYTVGHYIYLASFSIAHCCIVTLLHC